jgi:hypothetical protein
LFLLLRGSPWKQTDLNGWHLLTPFYAPHPSPLP